MNLKTYLYDTITTMCRTNTQAYNHNIK